MVRVIRPGALLLTALLLAVTLTACGDSSGSGSLTDTDWTLETLGGAEALDDAQATMHLADNDELSGSASCNRYVGTWETGDDDALTLSPGGMTMMACPEPIMSQEQAFMAAMTNTASFSRDGDELTLRNEAGDDLAVLQELETADLVGTDWVATFYNNGAQAVVNVLQGTTITAVFNDEGSVSGNSGCNTYGADYEVDGDSITIGQPISTLIACDQPIMDQEFAYLQALVQATTFELGEDTLTLHAADGALLVSYVTTD
jgi:heat shock protein HslJ